MEVRRLKDDELQHHGVKGQKWGVRRYQNYDGSLINPKNKKKAINNLKDYRNKSSDEQYFIQKKVRNNVDENKLKQYKKLYKKKLNAEANLEDMKWDTFVKKGNEQTKKIEEITKEYDVIKNDISNDLLGKKYSNKRMGHATKYGKKTIQKGKDRVEEILKDIASNELYEIDGKDYYKDSSFINEYYTNEYNQRQKKIKKKIDDAAYVGVSIGQLIAETLM
jgi:hypothetical protein